MDIDPEMIGTHAFLPTIQGWVTGFEHLNVLNIKVVVKKERITLVPGVTPRVGLLFHRLYFKMFMLKDWKRIQRDRRSPHLVVLECNKKNPQMLLRVSPINFSLASWLLALQSLHADHSFYAVSIGKFTRLLEYLTWKKQSLIPITTSGSLATLMLAQEGYIISCGFLRSFQHGQVTAILHDDYLWIS